jgi:hypothetical protein
MPASSMIRITQLAPSVRCARFTTGSRKALTPLLTASTPVIATQPAAKARRSNQMLTAPVVSGKPGGETTGWGCPLVARVSYVPIASIRTKLAAKR